MRRRSSPFASRIAAELAPLAPAVAVIALAAASAAAQGAAALGSPGEGRGASNSLADVQVGERGAFLRVALICRDECRVGARAPGVYYVPGLSETLDIDLKGRSRNAARLVFSPAAGGAEISLVARSEIVASTIKRCIIDGADASCIDIEFADGRAASPVAAAARTEPERPSQSVPQLSYFEPVNPPAAGAPAVAPPPLREAPGEERLIFASLAPPERLAPPAAAFAAPPRDAAPAARNDAARNDAARRETEIPRAIIDRVKAEALLAGPVDIGREAQAILGRSFDVGVCAGAEGRLKADAWALAAMVDLGFCRAIAGRLDDAEAVFIRLLEYTPDNYEALVGRALIAARRGARDEAQALFQDALNALPPIAESDRIVAAMQRL